MKLITSFFPARITTFLVIPISTWKAMDLLLRFTLDTLTLKFKFFAKKDRSRLQLPEVLPGLQYKTLDCTQDSPGGCNLLVVSTGRPKKANKGLMLCVHGFPESWFSWKHQMEMFRGEYEVVALQMRGYGGSDVPPSVQDYRVERLSDDIRDVILKLGYENAVLLAHDWGGAVCWFFAHRYPELVRGMVNMAGPHPLLFEWNATLQQVALSYYIFLFQMPLLPELWLASYDWSISEVLRVPPMGCITKDAISNEDIQRYKQQMSKPGCLRGMVNYYRAMMTNMCFPRRETVKALRTKLTMPVLCLAADKDGALSTVLWKGIERVAANAEVKIMTNCSHWVQQDQPQLTNQLVKEFLEKKGL